MTAPASNNKYPLLHTLESSLNTAVAHDTTTPHISLECRNNRYVFIPTYVENGVQLAPLFDRHVQQPLKEEIRGMYTSLQNDPNKATNLRVFTSNLLNMRKNLRQVDHNQKRYYRKGLEDEPVLLLLNVVSKIFLSIIDACVYALFFLEAKAHRRGRRNSIVLKIGVFSPHMASVHNTIAINKIRKTIQMTLRELQRPPSRRASRRGASSPS